MLPERSSDVDRLVCLADCGAEQLLLIMLRAFVRLMLMTLGAFAAIGKEQGSTGQGTEHLMLLLGALPANIKHSLRYWAINRTADVDDAQHVQRTADAVNARCFGSFATQGKNGNG